MKIKHQLSIATLVLAGVFATGCSQQQQTEGGSQVSGSQQMEGGSQQMEGGSQQQAGSQQVEGGSQSQQSGSQQQVEDKPVVKNTKNTTRPPVKPPVKPVNRWGHTHPAIPNCTASVRHSHKYNSARHSHKYSCRGMRSTVKPPVDVRALQAKLKAKGYYKGPIDGIVGPATRSALQRFMQR